MSNTTTGRWRVRLDLRWQILLVAGIHAAASLVGLLFVGFLPAAQLLTFVAVIGGLLLVLLVRSTPRVDSALIRATAAEERRLHALAIVESADDAIVSKTLDGTVKSWNPAAERMFGYSAAEIIGRSIEVLIPEDRATDEPMILARIRQGERITLLETIRIRKDGSRFPVALTFAPIWARDESGAKIVAVSKIVRDITDRKRAEERATSEHQLLLTSEARYRVTLDSILEGCQLLDFDWRYLYINDAAAAQNRRPKVELLGKTMMESWPGIESTRVFALLDRCLSKRVPVHEEIEYLADGATAWFDIRAQPVPEGVFVLSLDISERQEAEKALRDINKNLEIMVQERTVDLEAARQHAEDADRLKSAFLATMSHELRTPLNSIIGFTGMVVSGMAGPVNEEQAKQLGIVQNSSRHLLELINDVLDLSKIEAGQMEVRTASFDLCASISKIVASIEPQARKKSLTLDLRCADGLGAMDSDRRRVEQILLNLINNAIKFTERGGVTVTVDVPDEFARFRIADTGIGMKEQDLSKLFLPFRQIDSGLGRQHEGTGLGLAISRRLAELLGGTITAESVWTGGSVFTVRLPINRKNKS